MNGQNFLSARPQRQQGKKFPLLALRAGGVFSVGSLLRTARWREDRLGCSAESWSVLMDSEQARECSERDQLWATLRALRPEIDRLAADEFDSSSRQKQIITLLARIVAAEMDFRNRDAVEG